MHTPFTSRHFTKYTDPVSGQTMAEATINDVCGAKAKVRVKDEQARITLTLPASCDEEESVQAVLSGMMLTLISLREDYPDYIEVLEV